MGRLDRDTLQLLIMRNHVVAIIVHFVKHRIADPFGLSIAVGHEHVSQDPAIVDIARNCRFIKSGVVHGLAVKVYPACA